jgi:hypothetical protein
MERIEARFGLYPEWVRRLSSVEEQRQAAARKSTDMS